MANLIKHKRVEFTELFYDLVFVYAISKTTALIHHLHHGVLSWEAIGAFLITILVLVNNWMIQTVFTNRYGKNSLLNIIIMFVNMAMLLLISNMVTNDWQGYFNAFCWTVGTLTLTLFIQYLVEYLSPSSTVEDKKVIRGFLIMTGLRSLMVYAAALLPIETGFPIYLAGILITFIMPLFLNRGASHFGVNFPHLIERISLLVIITFGEMIMGIADFFTLEHFSANSVLFFIIMATLFLYYFGQFDHALDEEANTKGLFLIYSHYPIFIGLIMITVSMSFLVNPEANHLFVTSFFYLGLGLFQWAVLANSKHNKDYLRFDAKYYLIQALIFILGLTLSLLFNHQPSLVIVITTIMVLALELHFSIFYTRQTIAKKGKVDWDLK